MKVTSRSLSHLKGLACSAAVALLVLLGPRCQAAPRFDVFLGYDGMLPDRGWFPITCELQNDGPSFHAVIEVGAQQMGREQTHTVEVDLPNGTLKRVVIPVFTSAQYWNVRLLDDRGKVRAEQTMLRARVLPPDLPLVAGVCRTPQGLPSFPDLPGRYQGASASPYGAARLDPALFPDNPIAMESIDTLYLNSQKALELTQPQATALLAWLQNGGHLVIGVEQISDITGNRWLPALMPCDLTASRSLPSHHQLQDWLGDWRSIPGSPQRRNSNLPSPTAPLNMGDDSQFESAPLPILTGARRDGATLIGDDAAPLAVTADRGRGRITVLTFSPEREPFVSWKNRPLFWAKLAGIPRSRFESNDNNANQARLASDGIFGSMLDSKQVRKLPLGWLLLLLAAYLAVIGPLDQYCLKKLNRQMLTWITFPLYVVAFSGLIYLIGFHLRAGELEWNELNIVDVLPGQERAVLRGETYVSIYSPVNSRYPIESQQPFATLRGEYSGNYGGGQESSRVSVVQTGNNFQAQAFVPVWTSQLYVSEWLQGAPLPPLEMSASRQADGGWSVTIANRSDTKLTRAKVALGLRIYNLGDLPPQQTNTLSLKSTQGDPLSAFIGNYADSFRQAVASRRASFGNNAVAISDTAEGSMAACFLSLANGGAPGAGQAVNVNNGNDFTVFQNLDLSRFAGTDHAILLAWDPGHSPVDPMNRFPVKRIHRDTLLRLVVPVNPNKT
jgi:hypothetical protein